MRVLISAYTAHPGSGSEPGVGWMWGAAASRHHHVTLLVRPHDASAVADAAGSDPRLQMTVVPVELGRFARWIGAREIHVDYILWQRVAARVAQAMHEAEPFDVAHHLTFAVDWLPVGVASVDGLPLVWGPVGGTTGMSARLWRWLGPRGIVEEATRELITRSFRRIFADPVARRAAVVVAQNDQVAERFSWARCLITEPNAAIAATAPAPQRPESPKGTRTALFVGRLLPWKGIRLAIATIAHPGAKSWRLEVFGEGPEAGPARRLAARLGIGNRVMFHGSRPRDEVLQAFGRADAMLFPSMHDSAPWAVAESLTLGCPVVCLDRGGPATMLRRAGSGVAVPVGPDLTGRLAAALNATPRGVRVPVDRWTADRLPSLLDDWYATAVRR